MDLTFSPENCHFKILVGITLHPSTVLLLKFSQEISYFHIFLQKDNGDKIGLAMKTVNQTSGQDLDPNNIELR